MILNTTQGSIYRHILRLFIPIFIVDFFYITQAINERIWAGRILGESGLSLLALSALLVMLMSPIILAFVSGVQIAVSHLVGSKNEHKVPEIFTQSLILVLILNGVLWLSLFACYDPLMKLLNAPESILPELHSFLKIICIGSFFSATSGLIAAVWTGFGNSRFSLKYLFTTLVINVALTPLLISGSLLFPKLGILGAAYGFSIAQSIGMLIFLYGTSRKVTLFRLPKNWVDIQKTIPQILTLGAPLCAQNLLVISGVVLIQRFINPYGTQAIAAYGIVMNIDNFIFLLSFSVAHAIAVIVGHNKSAGEHNRAKECLKYGMQMTCGMSLGLMVMTWIFAPQFASLFISSQGEMLHKTITCIRILVPGYVFLSGILIFNGYLNGLGKTTSSMLLSTFTIWGLRVPLTKLFSMQFGLNGIWWGMTTSFTVGFGVYLLYFLALSRQPFATESTSVSLPPIRRR